jgi:hypothetical protein
LPAGEVGEVWSDRELASELRTQARNHAPKLALMTRGPVAKCTRALSLVERDTSAHVFSLEPLCASRTHPRPLPSREGR